MLLLGLACTTDLTPPDHGEVLTHDSGADSSEGRDCEGPEVCNGVDDDCDGLVDEEDDSLESIWFADQDGDGYGASPLRACEQPDGAVDQGQDCDDQDEDVHPHADEICHNGVDEDCDGADDCRLEGLVAIEELPVVRLSAPAPHAYCSNAVAWTGEVLAVSCLDEPSAVYLFHGPVTADRPLESAEGILREQSYSQLGLALGVHEGQMLVSRGDASGGVYRVDPFEGELTNDSLVQVPYVTVNEGFGESLAASPDLVVVGAGGFQLEGESQIGRAYAYADLDEEPVYWVQGEHAYDHVGAQVASVDVDGDGASDLVTTSRYGVLVAYQGASGQTEPDLMLEDGTSIGPSEAGLLVVFSEDVCVFSSGTGHFERQDADLCVDAPHRDDNGNHAYLPTYADLDGGVRTWSSRARAPSGSTASPRGP